MQEINQFLFSRFFRVALISSDTIYVSQFGLFLAIFFTNAIFKPMHNFSETMFSMRERRKIDSLFFFFKHTLQVYIFLVKFNFIFNACVQTLLDDTVNIKCFDDETITLLIGTKYLLNGDAKDYI